jgi:multiple antibiotic resistance protein
MNTRLFGEALITMLVIMDPPGNVPIFLSVTQRLTREERNRAAGLAMLTAFSVITMFALLGQQVLSYLHVSIAALQGAGGLLLLLIALQLLTGHEDELEAASPEQQTSVAMVPLGTPLLAGPGVIVATIVFVGRADGVSDHLAIWLAICAVSLITYLSLRFSGLLRRVLRRTGVLLLSRVAGMMLAAIAVQMIADCVLAFARQV